jgi:hypothetical protein
VSVPPGQQTNQTVTMNAKTRENQIGGQRIGRLLYFHFLKVGLFTVCRLVIGFFAAQIVLAASMLMSAIYNFLRDVWIPEGALTT